MGFKIAHHNAGAIIAEEYIAGDDGLLLYVARDWGHNACPMSTG